MDDVEALTEVITKAWREWGNDLTGRESAETAIAKAVLAHRLEVSDDMVKRAHKEHWRDWPVSDTAVCMRRALQAALNTKEPDKGPWPRHQVKLMPSEEPGA